MKNSKSVFAILLTAFAMSACAQKVSEFAEKYRTNALGAEVVDGTQTQAAAEEAEAKFNINVDVISIKKSSGGSTHNVTATILFNNTKEIPVITKHVTNADGNSFKVAEGSFTTDGYIIALHAVCPNTACNPYYASLEVYKDKQMIIQEGIRKYFYGGKDYYQMLKPAQAKKLIAGSSFTNNDLTNVSVMVGFLNSKETSGQTNNSSYVQ